MEPSIYRYILRHTRGNQILLILITALSLPFVYWSLDVPKTIINQAIGGENIPERLFGFPINQIGYLGALCLLFLALVIINGLFKYYLNVYRGIVGERMLHRFRSELYARLLRFPLPHFRRTSSAELIPMITSETEPLGGFIGEAFALPAFQGGLLLTYSYFIFMQDFFLGVAAIILYPPQLWLIPKLQRKVNELAKKRVQTVRELADTVGESVAGITDIHSYATAGYERTKTRELLDRIFGIRADIYRRKFFIKFLNNFLAQLTPFMFYLIGGYFVIKGELSLGALVAVIAAYKDLAPPWKELLKYYQTKEDVRVKYEQIIEQFQPVGLLTADLQDPRDHGAPIQASAPVVVSNVEYAIEEPVRNIEHASFTLQPDQHTAVVGHSGSGKEFIAPLLARLVMPNKGRIQVGDVNLATVSEAELGRWMAYVGPTAHMFSGSIEQNLYYGLRTAGGDSRALTTTDNKRSWSLMPPVIEQSPALDDRDWIDFDSTGVDDYEGLNDLTLDKTDVTNFRRDAFKFGLNTALGMSATTELTDGFMRARREFQQRIADPEFAELVQPLDRGAYNVNLSLAENLLFGTALDDAWAPAALASNSTVCDILDEIGLSDDLVNTGRRLTAIMLEMFADVSPESELFRRFSFIGADDLPEFAALMQRAGEKEADALSDEDRSRLLSLPFTLTVARHRLGLVDEAIQAKIVRARERLLESLGAENESVQFYDADRYSPAMTVQDNIIFGKVAYGIAEAEERVAALIGVTLDDLGLRSEVEVLGFQYHAGTAGARLTAIQRQKIAITRALLKEPACLILDQATTMLDPAEELRMIRALREHQRDRGLVCVLDRPELAAEFDHVVVMERGKVVARGDFEELAAQSNGALGRLLQPG